MTKRRPWIEHLDELLVRLRRAVFWLLGGAIVSYVYSDRLVQTLELPLLARLPEGGRLIFTAPFEKIWVYMRIAFFCGLAISSPLIAYEIARFVAPGLHPRERRRVGVFAGVSVSVFATGLYVGYRWVLPMVIDAALRFGDGFEQPFLSVSAYLNVTLGILLFTALMLEIPVVMAFLSSWGWVPASAWSKWRRPALVVNAVVSAFLSPPDAMSMILMMVPLQLLYECGVWGARVAQWGPRAKESGRDSSPA